MKKKVFPYQEAGVDWLAGRKYALLADEMGTGKTIQAIRGLDRILARKVLVICPSIARINWLREFKEWAEVPRKYRLLKELNEFPAADETAIVSYNYVAKNYIELGKHHWDVVVCDEAHFLKSTKTLRTRSILGNSGVIRSADRCWFLTGTPAPNHAGELWPMLKVFGVTGLSYPDFIDRYCVVRKTTYGDHVSGTNRARIPELRELLKKIMMRRLKLDVLKELPPIFYSQIQVEPGEVDPEYERCFVNYFIPEDRRKELFADLKRQRDLVTTVINNMDYTNPDIIDIMASVSQSVSTLRRFIGLQKVDPACELVIPELESGAYEKLVIFAHHRDVICNIAERLSDFGAKSLMGATTAGHRQVLMDKFQDMESDVRVLVCQTQTVGTAVNLTAAHNVLFVEADWVPGNNAQAVMRCHRIGQKNPVHVRFLSIFQTLDEHITQLLRRKTEELTRIFDVPEISCEQKLVDATLSEFTQPPGEE